MAPFFGITSLGPPNSLYSNLVTSLCCESLPTSNFREAFDQIQVEGQIRKKDILEVLRGTYGFELLDEEKSAFLKLADYENYDWENFRLLVEKVRNWLKEEKVEEYDSYEFMQKMRKN